MSKDYIYSSENDGESNPDALLKDMSSVMKGKSKDDHQLLKALTEQLSKQQQSLNNLIRENKTLRVRNTNLINETRNMINQIHALEQQVDLISKVLGEFSKRLDYLENNAIIKNNR